MSKHSPYARFLESDLTLRDYLAIDRTVLANERTFLSYVNTALALVVAGVSLIKFFTTGILSTVGALLIFGGVLVFGIGLRTFVRGHKKYQVLLTKERQDGGATHQ